MIERHLGKPGLDRLKRSSPLLLTHLSSIFDNLWFRRSGRPRGRCQVGLFNTLSPDQRPFFHAKHGSELFTHYARSPSMASRTPSHSGLSDVEVMPSFRALACSSSVAQRHEGRLVGCAHHAPSASLNQPFPKRAGTVQQGDEHPTPGGHHEDLVRLHFQRGWRDRLKVTI